MTQRGALVVGSALAAGVISSVVVFCVRSLMTPGRIEEISWWRIQVLTVWPAIFAVAMAALWITRKSEWQRQPTVHLAGTVCAYSYIFFGLAIVALFIVEDALQPRQQVFGRLETLGLSIMLGAMLTFAGMLATAVPAFLTEIAVVRFVRKRWKLATAPEVVP